MIRSTNFRPFLFSRHWRASLITTHSKSYVLNDSFSIRFNSHISDPVQNSASVEKQGGSETAKKSRNQADWIAPILTYEEVKRRSEQPSPNAYLIDVREPDEVIQGSIPSSVNLPLSILGGSLHLPEDEFKDKYGFAKPGKGQEIVFYCRSGKRSATACDVATRNGFRKVLNYEGSWLDWTAKNSK